MLFLNNAFTKDITEYDGEVLKEVKTVDGKIYLSNGAIIKEGVVGKSFAENPLLACQQLFERCAVPGFFYQLLAKNYLFLFLFLFSGQ